MLHPYTHLKTALIAEDNEDLRDLMQSMVEGRGIKCKAVKDGQLAYGELLKGGYDLLITDFRMPVLDGVELLQRCRQNGIHIPVIFISSDADLARLEQIALADCCATVMFKPLNHAVFLAALGAADNRTHHLDCIHNRNTPVK